eukprot:252792-Chlamydomonas_euryale.AAC.1
MPQLSNKRNDSVMVMSLIHAPPVPPDQPAKFRAPRNAHRDLQQLLRNKQNKQSKVSMITHIITTGAEKNCFGNLPSSLSAATRSQHKRTNGCGME